MSNDKIQQEMIGLLNDMLYYDKLDRLTTELAEKQEEINRLEKERLEVVDLGLKGIKYEHNQCEQRIQQLQAELDAAKEKNRWRPVNELPEESGEYEVLIKGKTPASAEYKLLKTKDPIPWWSLRGVTHWRLIILPEQEG